MKEKIVKAAGAFAQMWFNRPQCGCDERTLASMLERLLCEVEMQAREEANENVKQRLLKTLGL